MLEAITLAGNAEQVREEIAELRELAEGGEGGRGIRCSEAKLSRLRKDIMQDEGFFDHSDQRLLLFTEFKDTLGLPDGTAEGLGLQRRLHPWRHEAGLPR